MRRIFWHVSTGLRCCEGNPLSTLVLLTSSPRPFNVAGPSIINGKGRRREPWLRGLADTDMHLKPSGGAAPPLQTELAVWDSLTNLNVRINPLGEAGLTHEQISVRYFLIHALTSYVFHSGFTFLVRNQFVCQLCADDSSPLLDITDVRGFSQWVIETVSGKICTGDLQNVC